MGAILKILILLVLIPVTSFSQYANDWIKQGQVYYRIPTARDGVYKLGYQDLQNAGVPVNVIDPRLIQIFHRGIEQAIWVEGQSDAVFNSTDYIEFYGRANDGTVDKKLYKPAAYQPHSYYNLYSDTTSFFLTWSLTSLGKRIEVFDEINVNNLPTEQFHLAERLLINSSDYAVGLTENDFIQYTHFDQGEGWTGKKLQPGQSADYIFDSIINPVINSGNPILEILLVGLDKGDHNAEVYVGQQVGSLRLVGNYLFNGFDSYKIIIPITWTDVGSDGKLSVRLMASSLTSNRPQFSTSYLKLNFPQGFQSTGITEKIFNLKTNSVNKSFVEFENTPAGFRLWDVTDPSNITSIATKLSSGNRTAVIPETAIPRKLFAFNITSNPQIKRVSFRFIDPNQSNFIIISNKLLMKPGGSYADPVKAYGAYRASAAGGGFDTLVVSIDLLYNQFNYGETSPSAIYEFMRYLTEKGNPKYLFLIGKGRDVFSDIHRKTNIMEIKDLVPSAGYPGSDMNFTTGLKGTLYEPAVPTGRLSATSPAEVAAYLNKIKEYETPNANADWQKRGLHLSGGILQGELPLFRYFLDQLKIKGEGPLWGSAINTIAKREPSQVELINISDEINTGVNQVTFFGHSSSSTIDIDIGFVTDPVLGYNNPGKYPVFLINGCNAGNFFLNGKVFGEDWINATNKGARNFIAHSSFAFTYSLQYYSELFYEVGYQDSLFIEKGIGDVQKEVARRFLLTNPPDIQNITQVQQMVLLGDPAVKLFSVSKPDFEITNSDISLVSFNENQVTARADSFAIKLIVRNNGLAKEKPLSIRVLRTLANGSTIQYDSIFNPVLKSDTLYFKIYREQNNGGGNNLFNVILDPENRIQEINEGNNTATLSSFIASNATINLFPSDFAIVNQNQVTLRWQDSNPFSNERVYRVQLDTTREFNSPYLKQFLVTGKVLAVKMIEILNNDSTVYYWRTRFDAPDLNNGESSDWQFASFSYVKNGEEGWAQLKNKQLVGNVFNGVIAPTDEKKFEFENQVTSVSITTFGNNSSSSYTDVSVKINDAEYNLATQGQPCRNNTINLLAFNKSSAIPYATIPFNFQDPRTCGREPQLINSFSISEIQTTNSDDLIEAINRIGVSDSVILFSIGDAGYQSWPLAVKLKLGEIGVSGSEIDALQSGEPVIIYGKKGAAPGAAIILKTTLSPSNQQLISNRSTVTGRKTNGYMKSPLIGPASAWKRLEYKNPRKEVNDSVRIDIYGISLSGDETLLIEDATENLDLTQISEVDFPYMRLVYFTEDEIDLTPADWNNWFVYYEPAAEGILLFDEESVSKTIQEGQSWGSKFKFVNISTRNFTDSLSVDIDLFSKDKGLRESFKRKILPPTPGETIPILIDGIDSKNKVGRNDLSVSINNRILPEQQYDNNVVSISDHVFVLADKFPPVLEVTFDNRMLRNGEFVSSNPEIDIRVKDENKFLLMNDTTLVNIYLSRPCNAIECAYERISFSDIHMVWYPASPTTDFKVEYRPINLEEGTYRLKVEAQDVSGNESGAEPYEISFVVRNETTLSFQGVYPNPSSIGFFFRFDLSGNTLPQKFLLEIISPEGRLITRFNEEDVSQFNIGLNEIIWDGKDATGKLITNGVYLYRMSIQVDNQTKTETGKLIWIR